MRAAMRPASEPAFDFWRAIRAAGIPAPSSIIADGQVHRFSTNGQAGDDGGWYVLHLDGIPAGAFGDFRRGLTGKWCPRSQETLTPEERVAHQARLIAIRRVRDEEQRRCHEAAAKRAQDIWRAASPAPAEHPYLKKKGVGSHGIRVINGDLVIPLQDESGELWSLEFIDAKGEKRYLWGGKKQDRFHLVGTIQDKVCITEGYATAASVYEAAGYAVAIAFDAGNLVSVAKVLRAAHPSVKILLCGDNDKAGTGQNAAQRAAEAVGGVVAIPETPGMDWNDMHVKHGVEAVKAGINDALMGNTTHNATSPSMPSAEIAHWHTPPALARESNVLAIFEQAIRACGMVGEERCAKLLYLALTSRLLPDPVSAAVKGLSSSGKSYTTEATLRFFPNTAYISMTAMSERALIYMKEDFSHRTLVIFEAVALREQREKNESNLTAYFVRSLLSEGRISYPVTVRDKKEGGFVTKTIVKEGPTNVILTTTATELHGENETRLISIPTNDTREQTKAVMKRLAEGRTRDGDVRAWHALQEWLKTAEHRVTISYAAYLAEQVPPVAVRLRRDFKAILRLIEAHAILHQCSRAKDDDGRIVASEADYLAVRELVADLIAQGVGATVPVTVRETVEAVRMANVGDEGVTIQSLATRLKLDRSATQRRVQAARERGYLVNLEEKRGRPARYALGDPLPEELLPRSIPEPGCAHSIPEAHTALHTVNGEKSKNSLEGVQVCSCADGGIETEVF